MRRPRRDASLGALSNNSFQLARVLRSMSKRHSYMHHTGEQRHHSFSGDSVTHSDDITDDEEAITLEPARYNALFDDASIAVPSTWEGADLDTDLEHTLGRTRSHAAVRVEGGKNVLRASIIPGADGVSRSLSSGDLDISYLELDEEALASDDDVMLRCTEFDRRQRELAGAFHGLDGMLAHSARMSLRRTSSEPVPYRRDSDSEGPPLRVAPGRYPARDGATRQSQRGLVRSSSMCGSRRARPSRKSGGRGGACVSFGSPTTPYRDDLDPAFFLVGAWWCLSECDYREQGAQYGP